MYCLDEVNGQVKIAFASGVENEAKISLLFEQMVAHKYTWPEDKKSIFSLMAQINEKVHLETILNGDVVHKNIQKI
jgi:CxxC motif-containing protein